jgi:hypothetical protein
MGQASTRREDDEKKASLLKEEARVEAFRQVLHAQRVRFNARRRSRVRGF